MKTINILVLLLFVGTLSVSAQKSDVNISKSVVKWTATKIGGAHNGEVKIKSAYLDFKKGKIVGGNIVLDMTTITNTDLEDKGYNQKLVGHLKSDDFFGVATYPTAVFEVEKSTKFKNNKAKVTGNLTIKGKTEKITFVVINDGTTYSAELKVDRSKFDVRYGSNSFFDNLGDKAIDDMFTLAIELSL